MGLIAAGVFIVSLAGAAPPAPVPQPEEFAAMQSDAASGLAAGATSDGVAPLLKQYDGSHDTGLLEQAATSLSGLVVEGEPSLLGEWLAVLGRVDGVMEPEFDAARPPPLMVAPPEVNGAQMPPGVRPADIKDPAARAAYEAEIARNAERIKRFKMQARVQALHGRVMEEIEGMTKGEAVLDEAAMAALGITPVDRAALMAAHTASK